MTDKITYVRESVVVPAAGARQKQRSENSKCDFWVPITCRCTRKKKKEKDVEFTSIGVLKSKNGPCAYVHEDAPLL
jgi:hypothetical protein